MLVVELTKTDFDIANSLSEEMGQLKKSITKGDGNLAGFLGEIAAQKIYGGEIAHTINHDLVLPCGRLADVKTKRTTVIPKPDYDCSVAALNTVQKCDFYIFTRINISEKTCWVLGHYPQSEYIKDAKFLKKGWIDGYNKFVVKESCYNMKILDLLLPEDYLNEIKRK